MPWALVLQMSTGGRSHKENRLTAADQSLHIQTWALGWNGFVGEIERHLSKVRSGGVDRERRP